MARRQGSQQPAHLLRTTCADCVMSFVVRDCGHSIPVHVEGNHTITLSCNISSSTADGLAAALRRRDWYVPATDGTEKAILQRLLRASYARSGMVTEQAELAVERAAAGPLRYFWDRTPIEKIKGTDLPATPLLSSTGEEWIHEGRIWPKL